MVATDRYRLATSTVPTTERYEPHYLLPTASVDELLAADQSGWLDVVVADGTITLSGQSRTVRAQVPDVDFPPYRSWLDLERHEIPVGAAVLRAALNAATTENRTRDSDGVAYQVSQLSVTPRAVEVGASDDPDALVIGVNPRVPATGARGW